ncbi:MAG: HlyD family efflux transporter periplasmic adaptor subunit [Caldilineaceae bacterium]|nr:HlyD family efflux transporter periplasmic adaptor subunit [Caldilineaceae bacterium]
MRRVLSTILLLIIGAAIALGGAYVAGLISPESLQPATANLGSQATEATPQINEPVAAVSSIIVDARVVPVQQADLSMSASGIVDAVLVQEGDAVEPDQVLIRLDASRQRVAVAQAQAELSRTQAQLEQLKAGPRPEQVASAQAALDAALARLERITAGAEAGNIDAARAQVSGAQAGLAKLLEGASEQQLIAARADQFNAEAEVRRAQHAYNDVKWRNDVGALPQAADLERATNNLEAAKARLADLESGPTQADLSSANAQIRQAQANLDALQATLPTDVAAALADVQNLEAQLELTKAGARAEEIKAAEAGVASATAALQNALVSLADTELRAPFAGTVALVNVNPGEQVSGAPVVQLANLEHLQIETEDLTELQIVDVNIGDKATLEFDAIPDLQIEGTVLRIRPLGQDNRGDIVYTVVLEPDNLDPRLRWNMTAVATFTAE